MRTPPHVRLVFRVHVEAPWAACTECGELLHAAHTWLTRLVVETDARVTGIGTSPLSTLVAVSAAGDLPHRARTATAGRTGGKRCAALRTVQQALRSGSFVCIYRMSPPRPPRSLPKVFYEEPTPGSGCVPSRSGDNHQIHLSSAAPLSAVSSAIVSIPTLSQASVRQSAQVRRWGLPTGRLSPLPATLGPPTSPRHWFGSSPIRVINQGVSQTRSSQQGAASCHVEQPLGTRLARLHSLNRLRCLAC